MLRLKTLGGATVERAGTALGEVAAQRKSLALLALLAPAGDRGLSRDKIVAYLWPEADPERARHRLTQLLYTLRRYLDTDSLFLGGNDLRLNPALIGSDVQEFSAARRAGELERAAALYGGPFLDGFFLSGAAEFERWVENERTGLANQYSETVEALAADAAARGESRRAAEWWRRLAEEDPLSSRVTLHLMSALAAAGSRAAALEQARDYETVIRNELGAAPSPAVVALAAQLRQRPSEPSVTREPVPRAISLAVLPFANLGPAESNQYFADGLTDELTAVLAQLDGVRVTARTSVQAFRGQEVDAREIGRRLGVTVLIEGTVRQAGDRIRLSVRLVDASDGCHLWSERFERQVSDVFDVQDELSSAIVRGIEAPLRSLVSRQALR
jgi:TolB-like protein